MGEKLTGNIIFCLVLSLFWSWNWIIYQSPTPLVIELGSLVIPMRFIVLGAFAAVGFVCFADRYQHERRNREPSQMVSVILAVAVGACLVVCDVVDGSFDGELVGWPFAIQAVAMGIGSALLYMQVGSLFGLLGLDKLRMVTRSAIIALIVCIPFQVVFYYIPGFIRESAMVVILVGITLVCSQIQKDQFGERFGEYRGELRGESRSLVRGSAREDRRGGVFEHPRGKGASQSYERRNESRGKGAGPSHEWPQIPVKFGVTLVLVGLALGMLQGVFAPLVSDHSPLNPLSALGFFVAALMVFAITFHERFNFNLMLYKTALPVLALGFTVVAMQGNVFLAFVLCLAGYYTAQVVLWILCVYLAMNSPNIAKWIFAFMGALLALGQALGLVSIDTFLYGLETQMSAFMAVVILLGCLFMSTSQPVYESWGLVSPIPQAPENALEATCKYIADEKRFTERESEILPYLAQGRNRRIIADKMFLSENTIKTYVSHIYAKLEVHNQQELIEYVQKVSQAANKESDDEVWPS